MRLTNKLLRRETKRLLRFFPEGAHVKQHPNSLNERKIIMKRLAVLGIVAVLLASSASGQDSKKAATPEALKAEIEALKAAKVAWREIAWKSCLLEGLNESRARNKPALLWVFIDRPVDDARC
jgi:hypothetical protein